MAVSLVALLAAACSGPAVNTGPLGNGGQPGSICARLHQGQVLSYGIIGLQNMGSSPAVIEKVSLMGARHLRLVAAYVVPITGHMGYGVWDGYPPPPRRQRGVEWSHRQVARGARLPANRSSLADLVEVLQPLGPVGTARATDVFYREGGTQYHMRNVYAFKLLVGQKC